MENKSLQRKEKNKSGTTVNRALSFWIVVLFLFQHPLAFAQFEIEDEGPLSDSLRQPTPVAEFTFDSLKLTSFFLSNIRERIPFRDSILAHRFIQYNPLFESKQGFINLGNNGSANAPLGLIHSRNGGIDFGMHAYDAYKMNLDSFRWYNTNIPYTDLFFSNGKTAEEFRVMGKFTKTFAGGWTLNVDYERIIEEGYYQNQATKQSSISTGMWHKTKNGRSNTFITYIGNIHQEVQNGGIRDTTYLDQANYTIRNGIPVHLSGALSRNQDNQFSIKHFYLLNAFPDSLRKLPSVRLELVNQLTYENGFFKYYDDDTDAVYDTLYYGNMLIDPIGIRHYIDFDRIKLSPSIQLSTANHSLLRFGVDYSWWMIGQEPLDLDHKHDIKTFGKLRWQFLDRLKLNVDAHYHLGSTTGDYGITPAVNLEFGKYFLLNVMLNLNSSHPSLIEQQFFISTREISNNEFKSIQRFEGSGGISIPVAGFSAALNYKNISNFIYFDKEDFFVQHENNINILDMGVRQNISYKGFHLDNTFNYFYSNTDVVPLPDFYLQSSLYFKGPVWGNRFELFSGLELYLTDSYAVPSYQAAIGQFYTQDTFETDLFPVLNFFLSFKVQNFRLFARSENILNAFNGGVHFHAYPYPQNDFRAFRLGIRWQFID